MDKQCLQDVARFLVRKELGRTLGTKGEDVDGEGGI
jgi:hypothetical protein